MAGPVAVTSVGISVAGGAFVAVGSALTVSGGSVAVEVSVAGAAQLEAIMNTSSSRPEILRGTFMKSSLIHKLS
jgi:hypothetical protein